ncbi:Forkhead transcription factor HCM1 [Acromyrmex echinatior]|uniref:Forkhead transcription factor HCM1 n=1 Tax=Acromyrmex echinatior TaxID=103372 RepID=F4X865_ACREC|nr:Forkhead transcription factor HCM1 [Acromyrmex echinatior]
MIGPSSGNAGEVTESQCCASAKRKIFDDLEVDGSKRKVFNELDIDSFCDEVRQTSRKHYLEELETPVELVATSNDIIANAAALFSPMSAQEVVEESQVARLEVLLVDGTNCTWTTMSELEQQQNVDILVTSSSSSSSSVSSTSSSSNTSGCAERHPTETYIEELHYQPTNGSAVNCTFSGNKNKPNGRSHGSNYANDVKRGYGSHENSSTYRQDVNQATYPANGNDSRNFSSARSNGPKKPPFTYTELIEHALQERGELTVSAIYQWISEHFPYYKSNDDRWKNSVRHNLSINPHFRKGSKATHGAGHLWAIANRGDCRPRPLPVTSLTNSTQIQIAQNESEESRSNKIISQIMDEVEAATASITQSNSEEDADDILNSVTLEHSAEQILNGIKRQVEVQYLVPMVNDSEAGHQNEQTTEQQTDSLQCSFKESDFLNPVSKEVVAEECGLVNEGYLVTDPTILGLNVVDPEIIGSENLFGEELSFQFYELTSPSQLQSA